MRVRAKSEQVSVVVPAGGSASQSLTPNFKVNKVIISLGANTSITSLVVSGKSYPATTTAIDISADFGSPAEIDFSIQLSNAGTADETATIAFDGLIE